MFWLSISGIIESMCVTCFSPDYPEKLPGINKLLKSSFSYSLQTTECLFIPRSHVPFPTPRWKSPLLSGLCQWTLELCCAEPAAQDQPPAEGLHPKSHGRGCGDHLVEIQSCLSEQDNKLSFYYYYSAYLYADIELWTQK